MKGVGVACKWAFVFGESLFPASSAFSPPFGIDIARRRFGQEFAYLLKLTIAPTVPPWRGEVWRERSFFLMPNCSSRGRKSVSATGAVNSSALQECRVTEDTLQTSPSCSVVRPSLFLPQVPKRVREASLIAGFGVETFLDRGALPVWQDLLSHGEFSAPPSSHSHRLTT